MTTTTHRPRFSRIALAFALALGMTAGLAPKANADGRHGPEITGTVQVQFGGRERDDRDYDREVIRERRVTYVNYDDRRPHWRRRKHGHGHGRGHGHGHGHGHKYGHGHGHHHWR